MDIEILLILQQFREGAGQILEEFLFRMTYLADKNNVIILAAMIYWCVDKEYGDWLWLGWSANRLFNDLLKAIFCIPRPWVRDPRVSPSAEAKASATGYSFPSGHATGGASVYGSGVLYRKFKRWLRILFGVIMVLVAFSRPYLGVHTPQDVLCGVAVGLLVMWCAQKYISWEKEHPDKELLILVIGVLIISAIAVFAWLKPYPADDFAGKAVTDIYKGTGWCLAVIISRFLEHRYVGFSTDVSLKCKIERLVPGLLGFYILNLIIVPYIKSLADSAAITILTAFLLIFYLMFVVPYIFSKVEKKTS